MAANGWITIDRRLTDHWIWKAEKFTKAQAWIDLILNANHSKVEVLIKGEVIQVERGQQIRSQITLAKLWKWDRKTVKRFLLLLEKEGMILVKSDHLTSYITICKYSVFQNITKEKGQQKGHQEGQHPPTTRDTNNNENKETKKQSLKDMIDPVEAAFDHFWVNMAMPKKNKRKALASFKLKTKEKDFNFTDPMIFSEALIQDGKTRLSNQQYGFNKMHPLTYLNGYRWEDDYTIDNNGTNQHENNKAVDPRYAHESRTVQKIRASMAERDRKREGQKQNGTDSGSLMDQNGRIIRE